MDGRSENVSGASTVKARLAARGGADECVHPYIRLVTFSLRQYTSVAFKEPLRFIDSVSRSEVANKSPTIMHPPKDSASDSVDREGSLEVAREILAHWASESASFLISYLILNYYFDIAYCFNEKSAIY